MGYRGDMLLGEVVDAHPSASDVLLSFGLPCFKCVVADTETLAEGARAYGLDPARIIEKLDREAPLPVKARGKSAGRQ